MRRVMLLFIATVSCKNAGYLEYDYVRFGKEYEVDMVGEGGYYTKFKSYRREGKYFWEIAGDVMEIGKDGEWITLEGYPLFIDPPFETSWKVESENFISSGREVREGNCFLVSSRLEIYDDSTRKVRNFGFRFCKDGIDSLSLGADSVSKFGNLKFIVSKRVFYRIN